MIQAPAPIDDPLLAYPGYLLRRASVAALSELNRNLAAHDLRHAEFALLNLIRANAGINQSEAGRMLDIQRPNMATLVARLEKRGLLARKPIDRRSFGMRLTPAGRRLVKKAVETVEACEQALIEGVPAELRAAVKPVLLALWQGSVDADDRDNKPGGQRNNINDSNNRRSA